MTSYATMIRLMLKWLARAPAGTGLNRLFIRPLGEAEKAVTSGGNLEGYYSDFPNRRVSGQKRGEIPVLVSYLRSHPIKP
jgi:hypothetical protein